MFYEVLVYKNKNLITKYEINHYEPIESGCVINVKGRLLYVTDSFHACLMALDFDGKIITV